MGEKPNAHGNWHGQKGRSGRKSMYEERQDAIWHEDIWKNAQDIDSLINRIKSRKYAARDIAALKILQGDKTLIAKFMDKLIPTKIDIQVTPIDAEAKKSADLIINDFITAKLTEGEAE